MVADVAKRKLDLLRSLRDSHTTGRRLREAGNKEVGTYRLMRVTVSTGKWGGSFATSEGRALGPTIVQYMYRLQSSEAINSIDSTMCVVRAVVR